MYLQSEDRQPFYAKISSQVFSSSENGYLIIPKLVEGSYQVDIGFARSTFPEQHFLVQVGKKDLGFQLRNGGQKGWALANLRSGEVLENKDANVAVQEFSGTKKTDAFSAMLANIVNDSAILYSAVKTNPPPAKTPPATIAQTSTADAQAAVANQANEDSVRNVALQVQTLTKTDSPSKQADAVSQNNISKPQSDSPAVVASTNPPVSKAVDPVPQTIKTQADSQVAVSTNPPLTKQSDPVSQNTTVNPQTGSEVAINSTTAPKTEPVAVKKTGLAPTSERPFITRISEATQTDAYEATYLEQYNFSTDTIRISIPFNEAKLSANQPVSQPKTEQPAVSQTSVESKPSQVTTPPQAEANPTTIPVVKSETPAPKKTTLQVMNSDCKNFASDFDVDKLRVKLIAEYAIEDKLLAAKKVFKQRCFSVKQIRALTELFPSDETKYQFFDAAYPFVSDSSDFYQLEELIKNDYFKNRFKAMIHR